MPAYSSYRGSWCPDRIAVFLSVFFALSVSFLAQAEAQVTINSNGFTGFSFTTATAGSEPAPQSNALTSISYNGFGGGNVGRITVTASGTGTWHAMSAVAINLTATKGSPGSPQTVSLQNGVSLNFITAIPGNAKNCTGKIQYTASPLFSEGSGTFNYSITYTIVTP